MICKSLIQKFFCFSILRSTNAPGVSCFVFAAEKVNHIQDIIHNRALELREEEKFRSQFQIHLRIMQKQEATPIDGQGFQGLEVWIEILGKRMPLIQEEDGKSISVMEASEPYTVTPYSIFAKNTSGRDLYVHLGMKEAQDQFLYLIRKNGTHEFTSFRGENFGFKLVPVTRKAKKETEVQERQEPKEYGHFIFEVKSVIKCDQRKWVPGSTAENDNSNVFEKSNTSGGSTSSAYMKKVELVSAGKSGGIKGHFVTTSSGAKLGEVHLYYASIADMGEALHQQSLKRSAAKLEQGGSSADGTGVDRPVKKAKVEVVELDLTSDVEDAQ